MRHLLISVVALLSTYLCKEVAAATSPTTFWFGYPSCAVTSCLAPLTTSSGCEINDNLCVCTTASFVSSVAECLGQNCPSIGSSVYSTYSSSCQSSGYSLAISKVQFLTQSNSLTTYLTDFWAGYPDCAKNECLVPVSVSSGCEVDNNQCFCTNSTFVSLVAACVGQQCPSIDNQVYQTYSSACLSNGGYTVALSGSQWANAGSGGSVSSVANSGVSTFRTSTLAVIAASTNGVSQSVQPSTMHSTTPGTTVSTMPTATTQPTDTGTSSGYTEDQKIALGVGIGLGVPTLLATIWTCLQACNRRSRLS